MHLGVVDQSPVRAGGQRLRRCGRRLHWPWPQRQWVTSAGWQSIIMCPILLAQAEILVGQIAAHTQRIRVGSGGVMLSHYSAFKVAEHFRLLETLYPGRIDLGIGRAPGSDHSQQRRCPIPDGRVISAISQSRLRICWGIWVMTWSPTSLCCSACRTGPGDHAGSVAARLAHGIGLSRRHAGAAV